MIQEVDFYGNGHINYNEFISATLSCQEVLSDELLWTLFKNFDIDDTGYISVQNLRDVFHKMGRFEITEEEIKEAIKAHDATHLNKIGFKQFKKIFFQDQKQSTQLFPDLGVFDALSASGTMQAKRSKGGLNLDKPKHKLNRRYSGSKNINIQNME